MDGWTTAWLLWLSAFVAIEGKALWNSRKGDTLSEKVWSWFNIDKGESNWTGKRVVLVGFLAWLFLHLGFNIV